jgi:hypothetical protein
LHFLPPLVRRTGGLPKLRDLPKEMGGSGQAALE